MNRFAAILLVSSALLGGCATPNVKYADLQPATTATLSEGAVTIHIGSDIMNSACWTRPKAEVDGTTISVVGYRTLWEQSREFVIQLPKTLKSKAVPVVWIDPDGSRNSIPLKK